MQQKPDVVLSCGENCQTNVLYFALYVRLLYDASCIIGCCMFGFHVPECHVYHSQVGTLCSDVCTVKVELEQYLQIGQREKG